MALPAIIAPTLAIALLQETMSFCQAILNYNHQLEQVELQREQMHRQADIAMQQLTQNHEQQMSRLHSTFAAHTATVQDIAVKNAQDFCIIEASQQQMNDCLQSICNPATPEAVKLELTKMLSNLSRDKSAVVSEYIKNTTAPINALAVTLDSLRGDNQPHTFTDVN